jgi:hypothetical protein
LFSFAFSARRFTSAGEATAESETRLITSPGRMP